MPRLTSDQVKRMEIMLVEGKNDSEIARELQCSSKAIGLRRRKLRTPVELVREREELRKNIKLQRTSINTIEEREKWIRILEGAVGKPLVDKIKTGVVLDVSEKKELMSVQSHIEDALRGIDKANQVADVLIDARQQSITQNTVVLDYGEYVKHIKEKLKEEGLIV